jgi:protein tyrosine/serine phosphatase
MKALPKSSHKRLAAITAIVVIAIGGAFTWEKGLKPRVVARKFGVVEPGSIYRSGQLSRFVVTDVLRENRIGTIIFLSGDRAEQPDVEAEVDAAKQLEIDRYNYPLRGDGTGDIRQYARALQTMVDSQRAFKPVLVHCSAGSQRTGAAIAFYRLLVQNRPSAEVYAELRQWEYDPAHNPKLVPYVNAHMGELARLLVARKVIERVPDRLPTLAAG